MLLIESMIFLLVLLQIKHWYIDFVNQDMEEVQHKSIYLHWLGVKHSLKHGIGTFWCVWVIVGGQFGDMWYAVILGAADFLIHYHVDWIKMNYGNRDVQSPAFWNHLGFDQMIHHLTYIAIAALVVL